LVDWTLTSNRLVPRMNSVLANGCLRFLSYGLTVELCVRPSHWLKPMLPGLPPNWEVAKGTAIDHRVKVIVDRSGCRLRIDMFAECEKILETTSWHDSNLASLMTTCWNTSPK
jgi:hypothetical protein